MEVDDENSFHRPTITRKEDDEGTTHYANKGVILLFDK